jgi:glycosyltransferase involved in cell wall biosynthesis
VTSNQSTAPGLLRDNVGRSPAAIPLTGQRQVAAAISARPINALILVPHLLEPGRKHAIEGGHLPQRDYDALADAITASPEGRAEILDLGSVKSSRLPLVGIVRTLGNDVLALALLGFLKRRQYDVIFAHAENVAKPLALLLKLDRRPPFLITKALYMKGRWNFWWYKVLKVQRQFAALCFTSEQVRKVAERQLLIAREKLFFVGNYGITDLTFFKHDAHVEPLARQVCAVGNAFRDYATLLKAASELPEIKVVVDPTAPWSDEWPVIEHLDAPPNVEFRHCPLGALRSLYDESIGVAIPLYPNDIAAGLTTLLEAFAMGKAVIITCSEDGSYARRLHIVDGENVLLVRHGDVEGWKTALRRLTADAALAERLGRNARRWVEQFASREPWITAMLTLIGTQSSSVPPSLYGG